MAVQFDWSKYFGEELETKSGVVKTNDHLANKKVVGLYFSAHWVC